MKLYYVVASTYSQKALLALYEKNIAFEPSVVDLASEAGRAAYKEVYPMCKVPLLVAENSFIPESSIIVEYLEDEFANQGTCLIPTDKTLARRTRFKDRMIDLYVNNPIVAIFLDSRKPEDKRNPEAVAQAKNTLMSSLAHFEKELGQQSYMNGDVFTMADCAMFGPLFYAKQMGFVNESPNLQAYFERMMARPSVQKLMGELIPFLEQMNSPKN
ncbi:glutathione S-transferase family protein [Hydromonas duriensis]|uniref:Glutathione S-transferase n=1 Tax=Hydromonas duriensis TaxID=1527608 RepID=A0A4R6YB33_9BURK|nr:glutathione S-transferase family protein [Hydromonas duriensis]TDR32799.1 glutathione S-transferase [Hydromonas duriensis]